MCPEGGKCDGKLGRPVAKEGWWGINGSTLFITCDEGRCMGGSDCSMQFSGRQCKRCSTGYYKFFQECIQCPDEFGWTVKNTFTLIFRYGSIWLLWIAVNRFFCEHLMMADSLLTFAQIAGVLGGFDLNWPDSISTFLAMCGTLDFDVDVTGPGCVLWWTWAHDMILQLSLPLVVGLVNVAQYMLLSVIRPSKDAAVVHHRRADVIYNYLAFINCLYMALTRKTFQAFVCIDATSDGLKVSHAPLTSYEVVYP